MDIRTATPDDAAAVQAIYAPVVAGTAISFEIDPPGVDQMAQRIAATLPTWPWLVGLDDAGQVQGYVYASPHSERQAYQWTVNVSAYVRADARGRGVGKGLYAALFRQLVALGCCEACAGITLPNAASVALHESMGFKPVGVYRNVGHKLGRWHDVGWWQLSLQHPASPPALRAFDHGRGLAGAASG